MFQSTSENINFAGRTVVCRFIGSLVQ